MAYNQGRPMSGVPSLHFSLPSFWSLSSFGLDWQCGPQQLKISLRVLVSNTSGGGPMQKLSISAPEQLLLF